MTVPLQPVDTWAGICTVFHVVALSATAYRLWYRHRINRLWWDDFVIAFAFLVDILYFIIMWTRLHFNTPAHPKHVRVVLYFLSVIPFFAIVWGARVSMALSLTRIIPPTSKLRYLSNGIATLFGLIGIALIMQIIISCNRDKGWEHAAAVQCRVNGGNISAFSMDILGDVVLAVTPLIVLWHMNLAQKQKRLVIAVFAASIFTAGASIVLHTFIISGTSFGPGAGKVVVYMSHVEATIALFVSNLLVIVAIIYKRRNKTGNTEEDEDDGSETRVAKTVPDKLEAADSASEAGSH